MARSRRPRGSCDIGLRDESARLRRRSARPSAGGSRAAAAPARWPDCAGCNDCCAIQLEPHAQRHQAIVLAGEAQRLAVLFAVVEHVALIGFEHRARDFHRLGDAALFGPIEEEADVHSAAADGVFGVILQRRSSRCFSSRAASGVAGGSGDLRLRTVRLMRPRICAFFAIPASKTPFGASIHAGFSGPPAPATPPFWGRFGPANSSSGPRQVHVVLVHEGLARGRRDARSGIPSLPADPDGCVSGSCPSCVYVAHVAAAKTKTVSCRPPSASISSSRRRVCGGSSSSDRPAALSSGGRPLAMSSRVASI